MDLDKPLLIGTSTTATPTGRDATPPLQGATRDATATAIIVAAAGQAAAAACTMYGGPGFAPACDAMGSWIMSTTLGLLSGAGVFLYQFARKKRADLKARVAD